jgi:hypothetical protein
LAATAGRQELSTILREFAERKEPSGSIGDRAVRLGIYREDSGVLLPLSDFERALEMEETLDDLLLELSVAERLGRGPGRSKPVEEVARDLGLAGELGVD